MSDALSNAVPTIALRKKAAFYRPELDILRFFAFMAVFLAHATYMPMAAFERRHTPLWIVHIIRGFTEAGGRGVDLFFVLSAYLITTLLLREKGQMGSLHVRSFYIRRVLRIWPLYYFFILVLAIVSLVTSSKQFSLYAVPAFLLLSGNWFMMFFPNSVGLAPGPLWSISVEEQFYLFWPPVVARLSRKQIGYAAVFMIVLASLTRVVVLLTSGSSWHVWINTFARLDTIGGGILLAILLKGQTPKIKTSRRFLFIVASLFILLCGGYFSALHSRALTWSEALLDYPAAAAACVLMVFAFLGMSWRSKTLQYLGKISFGLYVYHMACVEIVERNIFRSPSVPHAILRSLSALALTIIVSAISYTVLEAPFLKLKRKFTYIHSRPV